MISKNTVETIYRVNSSFFCLYVHLFLYIFEGVCIGDKSLGLPNKLLKLQVSVVELSRPSASLPEVLSGIGSSLAGADGMLKELLNDVASSDGIQARMDGVMFEKLGGAAYTNSLFMLIKDCLSSF